MTLPDAPWRHRPGLDKLLLVLGAEADETRFVGGAVRDGLLDMPVSDIDIATIHPPQDVMQRLAQAGIKAIPTGLAHGTITAVLAGKPIEITTLRCDTSTDGRRAIIAYTDDWRADAARRDFTINALYAHPLDSQISDYFGGLDDLRTRNVRFIGDPATRIAEDHLRILRYFRFFARFGKDDPDAQAYAACVAHANSLMALSRERIADELLKLLALPDPVRALVLMVEGAILVPVVPEITSAGVGRFAALLPRELAAPVKPDPLLRLCALLPPDAALADSIAARLKLSNKARKRISAALNPLPAYRSIYELAFRVGAETARDRIMLDSSVDATAICELRDWQPPHLSVGGAVMMALGISKGPDIARALNEVREQWISEAFPGPERTHEIAAQIASKFQRFSQ
ncbi:MAG: CCA tRNA nucleotidyltransferase [Sphingobium sp.]